MAYVAPAGRKDRAAELMGASPTIAALGVAMVLAAGPAAGFESPVPRVGTPLTSLLFTDHEIELINEALVGGPEEEQSAAPAAPRIVKLKQPVGPALLHLSAIVYFSPSSWTIWLNGERVTPDRWPKHIEALAVERDSIQVKLRIGSDRLPLSVQLWPNQTYIVSTENVVEGAPRLPVADRTWSGP